MRKFSSLKKILLSILATLFAAATILYGVLFIYSSRWQAPVQLGFDNQYVASSHCELVRGVENDSPAEKAGLRAGDCILGINGRRIENAYSLIEVWARHQPGDAVELTIQRANVSAPLVIHAVFRAPRGTSREGRIAQRLGQDIASTYPIGFLVVGLSVLFLRREDPNAWLLALMFGGFIAIPEPTSRLVGLDPFFWRFGLAYRAIFDNMFPALFYFFFSVFPARSPLDRRLPWLKWVSLVLNGCLALPVLLGGESSTTFMAWLAVGHPGRRLLGLTIDYGLIILGFVSLIWNATSATTSEARRKIRVILWGTLVGVVPATLFLGASDFFGFHAPFWLGAAIVLLLWLFPLSFAYAVAKHRVLEIPVLLKRSARYLLVQRGFVILLSLLSVGVTLAFALSFARYLVPMTGAAVPGGIGLGTGFGILLLWTGTRIHRTVGGKIDRAFFRNAYDARMILEDLTEKTRTATDRKELAALLEHHLKQALQPGSFAVYLETTDHQLSVASGEVPSEIQVLSTTPAMMADLARDGRPWEVSPQNFNEASEHFQLAPLKPDCLVPMLGRDSRLVGLVVLGSRLSEESYSSEDKRLLAAVAIQAGIALEGIRLGEKIAERIEVERRAAQEMEFARQVQNRLFPQKFPRLRTLEYAGGCTPARQVGGDYYDFLELKPGRVALVLADIAGKGVSGALLMANLQANLRGQYAIALDDLPRLLGSVNHLFYENTTDSSYATLFFADYDDSTRRLRYVNCGHLPPLLLRGNQRFKELDSPDADVERLQPTSTVLGLFEEWECSVHEVQLTPGDLLVLYTDGVTEAARADGEEFGESRLIQSLRAHHDRPVAFLLEMIVDDVQKFSSGEQGDDITLVIAQCRA
jgi:sigma-B regulation protein RsbU (phosphoserine phosphatase)